MLASRRAWLALAGLSLLFFQITASTFTSLGVVLPAMVADLGWSWSTAGLGFTVLAVACGLASLAPTLVIRALGVRATLLGGGLVLGAGLLLFARAGHATGGYLLGAALAGTGFALAAIIPGAYVLARAFARPAFPLGLYFTAGGLGGAAGPLLGRLGLEHSWRGYWLVMAGLTVALAAIAAAAVDPRWERTGGEADAGAAEGWGLREALAAPQFWIITGAYTAYLLCGVTVNSVSVPHLTERGLGAGAAAAFLAADNLVNALSRLVGGALSQRTGPRALVVAALACLIVGMAALALTHGPGLAALYVAGVGVGYGLSYLATAVLLLAYFGRRRNLELFSVMCLVSTLAAVGPWLAGVSHDRLGGFTPALWAFAAVAAVALAATALMRPPTRRPVRFPTAQAAILAKDIG